MPKWAARNRGGARGVLVLQQRRSYLTLTFFLSRTRKEELLLEKNVVLSYYFQTAKPQGSGRISML